MNIYCIYPALYEELHPVETQWNSTDAVIHDSPDRLTTGPYELNHLCFKVALRVPAILIFLQCVFDSPCSLYYIACFITFVCPIAHHWQRIFWVISAVDYLAIHFYVSPVVGALNWMMSVCIQSINSQKCVSRANSCRKAIFQQCVELVTACTCNLN